MVKDSLAIGYSIENMPEADCKSKNEMDLEFYLTKRLSAIEFKNLKFVVNSSIKAASKKDLRFHFSMLGIGSSTYSEEYYENLRKYFLKYRLTEKDYIIEKTLYYDPFNLGSKNYELYLKSITEHNKKCAFDEKVEIISKEAFDKEVKNDEEEKTTTKSIKSILDNKGEDLDFIILYEIEEDQNKFQEFKNNFESIITQKYSFKKETTHLASSNYYYIKSQVVRIKNIAESIRKTIRIDPPNGRTFHIYFNMHDINSELYMKKEFFHNGNFVRIITKNQVNSDLLL